MWRWDVSDTKEVLALLGWAVRHSWDDHHNEDGDGIRALVQRARNQHDAERATIAALKADLARHKRALAAGPAALRDVTEGRLHAQYLSKASAFRAVAIVEQAQRRAMEEG
jgi:hypothetical protein